MSSEDGEPWNWVPEQDERTLGKRCAQAKVWTAAKDTESGEVPSQAQSEEQVPGRQAGPSG